MPPTPTRLPLTGAQMGLWYAQRLDTNNPIYNIAQTAEIAGSVDVEAVRHAARAMVFEAEALHLRFAEDETGPYQWVDMPDEWNLDVVDLTGECDPDAVAETLVRADLEAARSLDGDDLFTLTLFAIRSDKYLLYQRVHHLLADGFAAVMLLGRLLEVYQARVQGRETSPARFGTMSELLVDEQEYLDSEKAANDRQFWEDRLAETGDVVSLAPRADRTPHRLVRASDRVPQAAVTRTNEAVRAAGSASSAAVLTAAALYMHRLTGSPEITLGLPVTARRHEPTTTVPAMLSNIVPLRIRMRPDMSVAELLDEVRSQTRRVLVHQRYRYEQLRQREDARLFGPTVNILPVLEDVSFGGLSASIRNLSIGPVDDLSIIVHGFDDSTDVDVTFDGNPHQYDETILADHARRFVNLLGSLADHLDHPVGTVPVVGPGESENLLEPGLGPQTTIPHQPHQTVVSEFDACVDRQPHEIAVVAEEDVLTFAELDASANRLAHHLRASGAGRDTTVAVHLPRTSMLPVALLGVLKCGAAYLPLDPSYPAERLAAMIDDADPVLTLTSERLELPAASRVEALDSELMHAALAACPPTRVTDDIGVSGPDVADLAYTIYTSGSTGRPKGVGVEHRSLLNLLHSHRASLFRPAAARLGRRVRMAHTAGASFDASWDPILWMLDGHELHIIPEEIRRDPEALTAHLREAEIDAVETTPSFARALLEHGLLDNRGSDAHRYPSVLALGGEAVDPQLWATLSAVENLEAHNLYGPTEATVDSVMGPISGHTSPSLGAPVANTSHYVLDAGLKPAPAGMPGELYIAGAGVARGYLRRPDASSERFVADPYAADGSRMYRTGDVVRRAYSGELEFLGRADDQVKIRGYRVEPGEVETALARQAGVLRAVVLVRGDGADAHLVGYVTGDDVVDADDLRERLARQLPAYMVPSGVVVLDSFPLTPNGKLDKAALPDPGRQPDGDKRAPRGAAEQRMLELFESVLGVEGVGVDDDFFELGGHSLLATRLVAAARATFGTAPTIRDVFEYPTVTELTARMSALGDAQPLVAGERPAVVPLSPAQRRLWFLNRFDPGSAEYNMPIALRLSGGVDVDALRLAFGDVMLRHESLRTIFPWDGEEPRQEVLPESTVVDIAVETCPADRVETRLRDEASIGFDVTSDVPFRVRLFDLGVSDGDPQYALLIVLHHIASDGWSMGPLAADLSAAYQARAGTAGSSRPPLPVQYADYALWQHAVLGDENDPGSEISRQLSFWHDELAGSPDELALPTDRPRPVERDDRGGHVPVSIDPAVHAALRDMCRTRRTSLFMIVQAGFATLLTRLGAGEDVPIGAPVAGRSDPALDELIGFFANTVVLRTDTSGSPSFAELVNRVRRSNLRAYAHQDAPFDSVVDTLDPARSPARNPLFQVMLAVQETADGAIELPGVQVERDWSVETGTSKFDLLLDLTEHTDTSGAPAGITGSLEYAAALFDRATIEAVVERLNRLLEHVAADPQVKLGDIELVSAEESAELVATGRGESTAVPHRTVLDAFTDQVRRTPDAVAVVDDDARVTFAELDHRSYVLAQTLAALGAGRGQQVAVALPRSLDTVVSLLAALKTAAAYVPMDLTYPAERLAAIARDAEPAVVVTRGGIDVTLPASATVVDLDHDHPQRFERPSLPGLEPDDLAYVVYTSGSTGTPKGIAVEHRSLANLLASHRRHVLTSETARVAHVSGIAFDASWDPILWMIAGHELHMISDRMRVEGDELVSYLRRRRIDAIETTPSHMRELLAIGLFDAHPHPRSVALGGEAVDATLWRDLASRSGVVAHNFYGPSEFTVDSVTTSTEHDADPVIGRAIDNVGVLVLDDHLRPVPAGVVGELYLTGAGIARGYVNRPDLTALSFLPDPTSTTGARMYRTGDLVCRRHDGALRFVGRADGQASIRGFRVELGDIESAAASHPRVRHAVASVRSTATGDNQVVLYVVTRDGDHVDTKAVQTHLRGLLPGYMVPSAVTTIDAVPRTPNGKLDHAALPAPEVESAYRAPRSETERVLCELMALTLGTDEVGIDDDFFGLGGHSLLGVRLIARIRTALNAELQVRTLFQAPTAAGLAVEIDRAQPARKPARQMTRPDIVPLSYAQNRLWFLNRMDPGASDYNIVLPIRLRGDVDADAMRAALADLTARHETLRTIFPTRDGQPHQVVLPSEDAAPELHRVSVASENHLRTTIEDMARQGFDLVSQAPLRAMLVSIDGAGEHVLLVVLHHIAGDGASMAPLARDLSSFYSARVAGTEASRGEPTVQYIDFTLWQRELLGDENDPRSMVHQQLDFWGRRLEGIPEELELPTDHPRPERSQQPGGSVPLEIDAELHRQLAHLARSHSASVFMVLQAGLAALYTRLGAGEDIVLGSPVAGRTDHALDDLIGFFVNTVALRTDTSGNPSFGDLVERVRTADLDVFDHQDVPFERVVDQFNPHRVLGRHPLFQTLLTVQNTEQATIDLLGLEAAVDPLVSVGVAKFDLSFTFTESPGSTDGMRGTIEYSTALFDRDTVEELGGRLVRLMKAAVAQPGTSLAELDILSPEERASAIIPARGPMRAEPTSTVVEAFTAQVACTPEATAVVSGPDRLDFRTLNARADDVAATLGDRGIGRGDVVAAMLPRSARTVVALLGILKSGATYLPVDIDYPTARIAAIFADAAPAVVCVTDDTAASVPVGTPALNVDALDDRVAPHARIDPSDIAYVVYTSGSTGRPKGVEVPHSALAALFDAHCDGVYEPARRTAGRTLRVAHTTGIGFDAAWDPVLWLVDGHELHVIDDTTRRDPSALAGYVHTEGIDSVETTPSYARLLLANGAIGAGGAWSVALGGEPLDDHLWAALAATDGVRAYNFYGPTESTVESLVATVDDHQQPTIGDPVPGTEAYVLDAGLQPAPPGAVGELYLAGQGLAYGYRNRADLTAERFVANPFAAAPGGRMYRTGDLVRRPRNGPLKFVGRADDQVKIRGYRIETGDVRAAVNDHPDVHDAAVVVQRPEQAGARLVAYVVPADGDVDATSLRTHMNARLPDYMVPTAYVAVAAIPLTVNGKLDVRALPAPPSDQEGEPARNGPERLMCALFAEVLQLSQVGVNDNFFELGGHSLLVTQLAERIRVAFHADVSLQALFQSPTPSALLARVSHSDEADPDEGLGRVLPLRTAGSRRPLFMVHPATGLAWPFVQLLPHIEADQPLYGLQAPGMLAERRDELNVPDLTDLVDGYIQAIRSVQSEGPYQLLGFSLGGHLAHEIAVRLQAAGHQVDLLGILDAYPEARSDSHFGTEEMWMALLDAAGYETFADDNGPLNAESVREIYRRHADPMGNLTTDTIRSIVDGFEHITGLLRTREPGTFDGDMLFFRATGTVPNGVPTPETWRPYVQGRIDVHNIDSVHSAILRAPHARDVSEILTERLGTHSKLASTQS